MHTVIDHCNDRGSANATAKTLRVLAKLKLIVAAWCGPKDKLVRLLVIVNFGKAI